MSEVTYPVDAATLPQGSCPATYQELADLLASIYSVSISTNNTGIYVSQTSPADTTLVWKQLDSSLRPVRDYVFVSGLWLSRHAMETGEIVLYRGDIANIATFDGGDASGLSAISGPMWAEVTQLKARFPIGVGTLPSGTAIAVGDVGGEEKHVLTVAEIPAHTHPITAPATSDPSNGKGTIAGRNNTTTVETYNDVDNGGMSIANTGGGSGHSVVPPYYGIYFIERTIRQYYVVP